MDNLLTYRLTQEIVTKAKQDMILLKADFMKAYDIIKHIFIWVAMIAMGFHPPIIMLAKGLVEGA